MPYDRGIEVDHGMYATRRISNTDMRSERRNIIQLAWNRFTCCFIFYAFIISIVYEGGYWAEQQ